MRLLLKSLPQKCVATWYRCPTMRSICRTCRRAHLATIDRRVDIGYRSERGIVCQPVDFKRESLPSHLQMNFRVIDEQDRQLAMGRSLAQLRSELGGAARDLQRAVGLDDTVAEGTHDRITDWDFGELPEVLELRREGQKLVGYPALVDHVTHCAIEVFDTPARAGMQHRPGETTVPVTTEGSSQVSRKESVESSDDAGTCINHRVAFGSVAQL